MAFLRRKRALVLPFVLDVILCTSLFSVYSIPFLSLWTLAIIGVCLVMYVFCEFINKHNFLGGVLFSVVFLMTMSAFFRLIAGNDYGSTFQQWFLTGADQVNTRFEYLLALLISFPPFFSVVTYYFTNVLYRMSFLTLTSLIPCAVYVKVLSEMDNVYVCLIAILNVAILMLNVRIGQNRNARAVGLPASVISACVFVFVLLVAASAVPKESDARYYDRFEELFMDSNRNMRMNMDYSIFSEFSGGADSYRDFSNRRLYTLYGTSVPYFKRQTFDYYDFENDRWSVNEYYMQPFYSDFEWTSNMQLMSLSDLQKAIRAADGYESGFAEKYGISGVIGQEQIIDPEREIFVQPEDFGAIYYLSPARTISITPQLALEQIYVTRSGVFRNRQNPHAGTLLYRIAFYDEYAARFDWFAIGGANMDNETCREMLTELAGILEENGDPLAANAEAFLNVHDFACEYAGTTEENSSLISEEIRTLAREITAGCVYDWEKANALQNYFINNGYIYDLEYVSSDSSPEYFLFESKRGSCSDYASAFVLMARSVGLAARYAEGYSFDLTSRENVYIIRDSTSHAYPEVYIQNMGWAVFEPTVPSDYSEITVIDNVTGAINIDYSLLTAMVTIAGIMLAAVLTAVLFYPIISERIFVRRAENSEPNECIKMIYGRISSRRFARLVKRAEAYTPYETARSFEKLTGCDITELALMLEKVVYGEVNADENDRSAAMRYYSEAVSAAKKYNKEKHKNGRMRIR